MTPAARLQAAIELLDRIVAATQAGAAADTLIARYFKERRYAGSRDRRAVRDLVYRAVRALAEPPPSGRAAMIALAAGDADLAALFDGSAHAPAPIAEGERAAAPAPGGDVPDWLAPHLAAPVDAGERAALIGRAGLHLRANRLRTTRTALLDALPEARAIDGTADGLILPEGTPLDALPEWQAGLLEVQDKGSQIIAAACLARAGETVLDLCAGAGGKTLALAADMGRSARSDDDDDAGSAGRLIAADVARDRLRRLVPRAARAGAAAETLLLDGGREEEALAPLAGACDCVLVDAPCTGMGTWRRNPEARWRLAPAMLARATAQQAHVLALAAPLVRPGGRLVYAVCSLLDPEGRDRVAAFVDADPGWTVEDAGPAGRAHGHGRLLTPVHDDSDGFFVARLRKS